MANPLVGEAAISLPPSVVPIVAVAAFAKVGVSSIVAPYRGVVVLALSDAVEVKTTSTTVLADFDASSCDVAVMVTFPAVSGAVHWPVAASIVPALAVQVIPLVAPPVTLA